MENDEINHLKELLSYHGRHGLYQKLPPTLPKDIRDAFPERWDTRLDEERYNWIISNLDCKNKNILEIGANIGYFSSRFAHSCNCSVSAYEPDPQLFDVLSTIIRLSNLEDRISAHNTSITLDTIDALPQFDIILNLNVIQHAGYDFENASISSLRDWRDYSVSFLHKLRSRSDYMIFQMGYQLWGFDREICNESDIINYTVSLLRDSGWRPEFCGVLNSIPLRNEKPNYENIDITKNRFPQIMRNRLPMRYLFDVILSKIAHKPYVSYTFAQRPIFICKSE